MAATADNATIVVGGMTDDQTKRLWDDLVIIKLLPQAFLRAPAQPIDFIGNRSTFRSKGCEQDKISQAAVASARLPSDFQIVEARFAFPKQLCFFEEY